MSPIDQPPSDNGKLPVRVEGEDFGSLRVMEELSTDGVSQFIAFRVGEEEYGVDILAVREIKGWTEVTKLPNTPEYVRGVLNLRGIIVPVFDLRCQFGMGLTEATPTHVIIVVLVDDRLVGVLVDAVSEILALNESEISAVPETDLMVAEEFLAGLATADDRMVAIVDVERLFDPSEMRNTAEQAQSMKVGTEPDEDG